jgi:hypothetical protein
MSRPSANCASAEGITRRAEAITRRAEAITRRAEAITRRAEAITRRAEAITRRAGYTRAVRPWLLALAACHGAPSLVAQLRDVAAGDRFPAPELVPAGWMRAADWRVYQAAHVESTHPMTAGGPSCAAHGFTLVEDGEGTVLVVVALECGGELARTGAGELAIDEPIMASPQNQPRVALHFVAAVRPDLDALWASVSANQAGDLLAIERVYAIDAASRIAPILSTVGADPAAGHTAPDDYVAHFTGDAYPRAFETANGRGDVEQRWAYRGGGYALERPRL